MSSLNVRERLDCEVKIYTCLPYIQPLHDVFFWTQPQLPAEPNIAQCGNEHEFTVVAFSAWSIRSMFL